MPAFDVDGALRWARFAPRKTLSRREDADIPFVTEDELAGQPLLPDTCVYIDQMRSRAPETLERLIETRQINHSTVVIQELMHIVGALNPSDGRTARVVAAVTRQIRGMPDHRVFAPDADVLGRGALLSGILCRLQGYTADARLKALQDCVLFLQAQKLGFTVLTANLADFDLILQLLPTGRALFYRAESG